jgi:hypothetical protein
MVKWLAIIIIIGSSSATAMAQAPAWCKEFPKAGSQSYNFGKMKLTDDPMDSTKTIVGGMCSEREKANFAAAAAAHKEWSEAFNMNDDDWAGAAKFWAMAANRDNFETGPKQRGYWGLDPMDQWLVLRNYNAPGNFNYKADAMGELSALGRLGYVRWCMNSNRDSDVHLAICLADIEALDMKKVAAELHADTKHDAWMRLAARMDYVSITARIAEAKKKVAELTAKDPAYEKMFAIAAKTFKEWPAEGAGRRALLELAGEMENAEASGSRRASEGCEAKTLAALKTAASGIPAKKFSGIVIDDATNPVFRQAIQPIVTDPNGNVAASAYVACIKALGVNDNLLAWELRRALGEWPGYRGPRNSAISNIASAGLELDQRGAELRFPKAAGGGNELGVQSKDCGTGVLAAVKPSGKGQQLEFNNKTFTFPKCVDMRPGKHITRIYWDGRIERAGTCMKYENVTGSLKIDPVTVDAGYTSGIKSGMTAAACSGVVFAAWPKGSKEPSVIVGAPVK